MKANPRVGSTPGSCQGLVPIQAYVQCAHRLHQVSIQYDCTLTVVLIGTGIYLLCCYMLNTRQSVNPPNCQTVKLSNCQPVKLSNRQTINLREESPYCDARTLVGDNPARWFCSTLSYTPLYRFAGPATFVRQQSQSGNFPSNGISHPELKSRDTGIQLASFPAPI